MEPLPVSDLSDWELLKRFLPNEWETWGRECGALRRTRGFKNAELLLRTLLLYLVEGRSLKETALRVQQAGIAQVSSVAIWKRLKHSGEWFRLMNEGMLATWLEREKPNDVLPGHRVRVVDGTVVTEPGKTGSSWRIHYSVDLRTLQCDSVGIFEQNTGESFKRFEVSPGDILLGDRAYANRPGILHVLSGGGDVVVRLPITNVPLIDKQGKPIELLKHLRKLSMHKIGDWHWLMPRPEA